MRNGATVAGLRSEEKTGLDNDDSESNCFEDSVRGKEHMERTNTA